MPAPVLRILYYMVRFYEKKTFIRNLQKALSISESQTAGNDEARFGNTTGNRARCHCGKLTLCYRFVKESLYNRRLCVFSSRRLENMIF